MHQPSTNCLGPDGFNRRCPICRNVVSAEPSVPAGDAPCPRCGYLIWWFENNVSQIARSDLSSHIREDDKQYLLDLTVDSLDFVELVMEIEDEFGITVPDDDYGNFQTIGDVILYLNQRHAGL